MSNLQIGLLCAFNLPIALLLSSTLAYLGVVPLGSPISMIFTLWYMIGIFVTFFGIYMLIFKRK